MSGTYPTPPARDPRRPFVAAPFTRLARTHAFSVAGDALFTVGLAGSVFFAVPLGQARWKVGLYLLLTFAPFAVAAPLIGPFIDRLKGGRRWMIIGSLVLRALLCMFIVRDISHLPFYLEAFLMLVFAKAYLISRAAVVPTTVKTDQELVEANSKLSLLSGVAAVVAGVPGAILLKLGGEAHGAQMAVGVAGVVFAIGAGFATRLPKVVVAEEPAGLAEKLELRSAGIRLAASAMELIRGAVGLLLLVLAFDFKNTNKPLWYLGAIGIMAQAGVLAGAAIAPRLRKAFTESQIITGSLAATMAGAFAAAFLRDLAGAAILSLVLGATSGTAKQAFDALVQRDAPDANRGRSFARFETRFQLAWVIGAFLPVLFPFEPEVGFVLVGVLMIIGLVTYLVGQRRIAGGTYDWESPSQRLIREARSRVGAGRDDAPDGPDGPDASAGDGASAGNTVGGLPPAVLPASPPVAGAISPAGAAGAESGVAGPILPAAPTEFDATTVVGAPEAPDAPTTIGPGPAPLPPPPAVAARDRWEPPAGFVSHPLSEDDPTIVEPASTPHTMTWPDLPPTAPPLLHLFDDEADPDRAPDDPGRRPPTAPLDGPDDTDRPTLPFADGPTEPGDAPTGAAPTDPPASDEPTTVAPASDEPTTDAPTTDDLPFAEPRWRDSRR